MSCQVGTEQKKTHHIGLLLDMSLILVTLVVLHVLCRVAPCTGGLYVIEDLQISNAKEWMIRDILSWAGL